MDKKIFTIKSNDEVTLKENLHNYVSKIQGKVTKTINLKHKDCCKDPQYITTYNELKLFRSKIVVITMTQVRYRFDENNNLIGRYYYIQVRDRAGNETNFPIEFIDKSYCLRRDHKRISLYNKILICN